MGQDPVMRDSQARDARIEQGRTKNEIYAEYGKYHLPRPLDMKGRYVWKDYDAE
jgi:hypothetical protein